MHTAYLHVLLKALGLYFFGLVSSFLLLHLPLRWPQCAAVLILRFHTLVHVSYYLSTTLSTCCVVALCVINVATQRQ